MKTLSKSDFKLASSCTQKLVYKKAHYPTTNDTNEFMEMLAQGGYVIGQMATLYYPEGIEIEGNTSESINKTKELLQRENVVLFEPAIQSGQKLIRIDILVKEGKKFHLIEVKAKSFDSSDENTLIELDEYIEDVAFQYHVLKEAYPDFEITCSLFMPDKSKRTLIDGLGGWFSITKANKSNPEFEHLIAQEKPKFNKPNIVFKYENDPKREEYISLLKSKGILQLLNVDKQVLEQQSIIINKANAFLKVLNQGTTSSDFKINKDCKSCEFKTPNETKNGYGECWKKLPDSNPHIFDLYYGGAKKTESKEFLLNEMIWASKTSLYDINIEDLKDKKGNVGKIAQRQIIQIENTKSNSEWISPELKGELDQLSYPLHFVDFETYTGSVPFHKGMRPYELIAFQWSCHTIKSKGAKPEHKEWIHTGESFNSPEAFPNFEFANSLMKHIGLNGTPLMWATHENTVLRTILNQMEDFGYKDEQLKDWLIAMTHDKEMDREGKWIDMNQLTLRNYFHPYMKGKTSIKKVLPAIWSHFPYLHQVDQFKSYAPDKLIEGIIDPYDTLASDVSIKMEEDDAVSGGTDAMRAYQRIRFDESLSLEQKNEIRRQLLEYCKLDTMAMVIIGYHWGLK